MQFTVGWASCSLQSNGSLTLGAWDLILLLLFHLQTRKYFVRNFKCLPKFTIGSYYREKSGERKKSVRPGLRAYRLATPLACFAALLQNEMNITTLRVLPTTKQTRLTTNQAVAFCLNTDF